MNKNILSIFTLFLLTLPSLTFSQWSSKWASSNINSADASGWMSFQKEGSDWINRFYLIDDSSIKIMDSEFSESPLYTYNFTVEELTAGNQIYSLGKDLTGDGIVEFYVLGYAGPSDNYRESFRIIDITTGNTLFEKNDSSYYYSYPVIWDVDNDGTLECTFSRYDYPDYTGYTYFVFDTGVPTGVKNNPVVSLNFKLKQNYPNPFSKSSGGNPSTTIPYSLSKAGNVSVDVFDISGRLIKNLFSGFRPSGNHQVIWDGRNSSGNKVASGTYFYQINYNGNRLVKKMLLLK